MQGYSVDPSNLEERSNARTRASNCHDDDDFRLTGGKVECRLASCLDACCARRHLLAPCSLLQLGL